MNRAFNKNQSAFTIIELIVVVAILGILVLLAGPKLLGYVEKAELTRIQHDVKVMEQEMKLAMLDKEVEMNKWNNNKKNLGALVMQDKLFEKEGMAERIDASHLLKNGVLVSDNSEVLNEELELGVGGDIYLMGDGSEEGFISIDETYKIIPEEYKGTIGTRLGGTFYTNELGKVYYEHDKPLSGAKEEKALNCPVPLPDYKFEPETGTIVKWYGTETHLIIPSHFLVNDKCWPVKVIGTAAFMKGGFRSIVIPETVITIEDDAFKDVPLENVYIPGNVRNVGSGNFNNSNVTYGGSLSQVTWNGGGTVTYQVPSGGNGFIARKNSSGGATIVYGGYGGSSSNKHQSRGSGGLYIPPYVMVNGEELPVTEIDRGAYQGLGLISVILPETLERIEDYAFAGNQLEGITIPDRVNHIGNYAFAFNEVEHTLTGHRKATIGFINIKNEEQIGKVEQYGDIYENGIKVDRLKDEVRLLNHIWVTSIGNHVIDEQYVGENEADKQSDPIIFKGLGPGAFDGDETTNGGAGILTWEGNLDGKRLYIHKRGFNNKDMAMYVKDINGNNLSFINLDTGEEVSRLTAESKVNILIPNGANSIVFNKLATVYEIQTADNLKSPKSISNITSESDYYSIILNWQQNEADYEKAIIYRNDEFHTVTEGHSFKDTPLYADTEYTYRIVALNKYGNASEEVTHIKKTAKPEIIFKGLGPGAFDGDETTNGGAGTLTWEGNLAGKELYIHKRGFNNEYMAMYVKDINGNNLSFINLDTGKEVSRLTAESKINILIPNGANSIVFNQRATVYEIQIADNTYGVKQ